MSQPGNTHDQHQPVLQSSATHQAPWHTSFTAVQEVSQKCFPADAGRKPRLLHGARHMQCLYLHEHARADRSTCCFTRGSPVLPYVAQAFSRMLSVLAAVQTTSGSTSAALIHVT